MYQFPRHNARGFTFVELLVVTAVVGLFFSGLFGAIQFSIKLIALTKAQSGALAIANERIEYIRSLTYADIGTQGGIPNGPIAQNATSSMNGLTYSERILIQYIDAPDDGLAALDSNGIVADYKEVKVEVSWDIGYGTSTIFLLTDIVPSGIETTAGGGTLTVNVFDADVLPLPGAEVHIYNNTTTTTIDTYRSTNSSGVAMFSGAPAAANYQITVTDTGYSTDQTYTATTSNPNPITSHVAVIEGAVSTMNFQIDELSDLTVRTRGEATYGTFADSFADSVLLASQVSVNVASGNVVLSGAPGSYVATGSIRSTSTAPGTLAEWNRVEWVATTTLLATLKVYVYSVTGTSTYTLISDSDLPGNSAGFNGTAVDISGLNVGTYPALALGADLATSDVNTTPILGSWSIIYTTSQPVIPSINFTLRGNKTIGTTVTAAPIYKYSQSHSSGGSGSVTISNLEWDVYDVTLTGPTYNIKDACPSLPYPLEPSTNSTLTLTLVPASAHTLRTYVTDASGNPITNATVALSRSGYSGTEDTSLCGQSFFTGLTTASDYDLLVEAPGYSDHSLSSTTVDGQTVLNVTMTP